MYRHLISLAPHDDRLARNRRMKDRWNDAAVERLMRKATATKDDAEFDRLMARVDTLLAN